MCWNLIEVIFFSSLDTGRLKKPIWTWLWKHHLSNVAFGIEQPSSGLHLLRWHFYTRSNFNTITSGIELMYLLHDTWKWRLNACIWLGQSDCTKMAQLNVTTSYSSLLPGRQQHPAELCQERGLCQWTKACQTLFSIHYVKQYFTCAAWGKESWLNSSATNRGISDKVRVGEGGRNWKSHTVRTLSNASYMCQYNCCHI